MTLNEFNLMIMIKKLLIFQGGGGVSKIYILVFNEYVDSL